MADSSVGKNLKPIKFGVASTKPRDPSPTTKPNQFGQVFSADEDKTAGEVPTTRQIENMHARSDVDSSKRAQHHTLGMSRTQAAQGDHVHDGVLGRKIGPLELDPTTGIVQGELRIPVAYSLADVVAMLHNVIEFRESDT